MARRKAFTLIEVCVVVIIMGILAMVAVNSYGGAVNKAAEREAFINLDMIVAASEIYRMNAGSYYTTNNTADINTNLRTNLPLTASRKWDYRITSGTISGTPFACVTSVRFKNGAATTPCWQECTIDTNASAAIDTSKPTSVTCP